MKIYENAVNKPVSTILIFVGVIIFGLFSLQNMSVDMYPKMDFPTITVMTTYEGANAADIETNVSRILEDNLNTVENLKKITSRSSDNISLVQLEFEWGTDLNEAANDIRDVVGRVQTILPEDVKTPMIFKFSSSMIPVIILYATADESYPALKKILDEKMVNRLNRIDGVGAVSLMGAPVREVQINVDPKKIEAYNLSIEQIGQIIQAENVDTPGGTLDIGQQTLSIRVEGQFATSDEIKNIVIANREGRNIYLYDVATVKDTLEKVTLDERINGQLGVRILVQKQSGANTVKIAKKVMDLMPEIQSTLPPDVKMGVVIDLSESISDSINSLSETVMFAFIFVMLVVLFFLGRWRATFIIIVTIPVSLIVSFIYLYVTDSTLNIISLSSLSIAIGLVVDDAIVVLENITKHIERGSSPRDAAIHATNEVWLAVIATTLTIIAVFLPLTMLSGMAGIMFKELGWIVSLVTMVSMIAAITLTPMLASKMLSFQAKHTYKGMGILFKPIDKALDNLDNWYAKMLAWALHHRAVVLLVTFGMFLASLFLITRVPTDFFPKSDSGYLTATVELEQGVSVNYSMAIARRIDSIVVAKYPEIILMSTSTGTASGNNAYSSMQTTGTNIINYTMRLPRVSQRERTVFEIGDSLRRDINGIAEVVQAKIGTGSSGPGSAAADIVVKVFGYDLSQTEELAKQLRQEISAIKGATDVQLSRNEMRPEYRIRFDRDKLASLGLNTATASMYVRNRINGLIASKYREEGDEYDIIVRYGEQFRRSIEEVEDITIYNASGRPIKLREVGTVKEEFAPPTIERENRQRLISVNVTLSGAAMSDVIKDIKDVIARTDIPDNVFVEIGGSFEDQQESFSDILKLFVLIVLLVYIVMATQFESLLMPLIIMPTILFAFTGVFLALYITNTSLSIIALIGAIMLVGIVVKNGIVMIDFTNLLRERGLTVSQAVISAGKSRLRPVIMTSLTTILGMLPLAIGFGEGSETWQPMGIAVIGGLTFSTLLTLIVIPVVYTLFGANKLKKQKRKQARELLENS